MWATYGSLGLGLLALGWGLAKLGT
jgi:hypothetical protein